MKNSRQLSLVALVAAAAIGAACSNVHTKSGATTSPTATPTSTFTPTPTPTSTATSTPTPIPTPTPAAITASCSIVWANDNQDGTFDLYEVDVDGRDWTTSNTVAVDGTAVVGYYVLGYDPTFGAFDYAGQATNGSIALNVAGVSQGDATSFSAATPLTYWDATNWWSGTSSGLEGQSATGGTGTFSGALSNPDPTSAITPGAGVVDMTIYGTEGTFGGATATEFDYAVCDTTSSLVPQRATFRAR